ncbi:putative uncharacterized protein [Rhodococcus sp. AW25M09]|uniref:DUF721 family protein n=1 Tax=Rhodococcus sp. AW25M09 TaxID=1268303 RepID=UPI0002AD09A5|nr:DUF721 family protein [Rhodococcus sp. AW25M09]CCQ14185.1 putative uncharacterized protein [Rhodococcus sp. AW25M09]
MNDEIEPAEPAETPELKGVDLARRALEDARAAAKASGKSVGQGRSSPTGGVRALRGRRRRGWSGAGPDDRDPQAFGALANSIASKRGWSAKVSEGAVLGRWSSVVGEDISAHAEPTGLKDGVLSISAESTAWATQLRLMQSQILAKIAAAVGHGVVTSLRITGPTTQSWRKGERHVRGRGPRDTYG